MSERTSIECWVNLRGEDQFIEFDSEDLEALGDEIFVFYAWYEDDLLACAATLRGEQSPVPEGAEFDGPWFIDEREVADAT